MAQNQRPKIAIFPLKTHSSHKEPWISKSRAHHELEENNFPTCQYSPPLLKGLSSNMHQIEPQLWSIKVQISWQLNEYNRFYSVALRSETHFSKILNFQSVLIVEKKKKLDSWELESNAWRGSFSMLRLSFLRFKKMVPKLAPLNWGTKTPYSWKIFQILSP